MNFRYFLRTSVQSKIHFLFSRNQHQNTKSSYDNTCECKNCPCKNYKSKRLQSSKDGIPQNAIVFQLPKYRDPKSDTYSHTVYKKEFCSRTLMRQHAALAQKKASQRPKAPPVLEQEIFACKTTTATDYRWYRCKEVAACKPKFPRTKRKEEFYFQPGEYSCSAKFPQQSLSHDDYSPKVPIVSDYRRFVQDCDLPPFEGISCYKRDYDAPPVDAYSKNRVPRKRAIFD